MTSTVFVAATSPRVYGRIVARTLIVSRARGVLPSPGDAVLLRLTPPRTPGYDGLQAYIWTDLRMSHVVARVVPFSRTWELPSSTQGMLVAGRVGGPYVVLTKKPVPDVDPFVDRAGRTVYFLVQTPVGREIHRYAFETGRYEKILGLDDGAYANFVDAGGKTLIRTSSGIWSSPWQGQPVKLASTGLFPLEGGTRAAVARYAGEWESSWTRLDLYWTRPVVGLPRRLLRRIAFAGRGTTLACSPSGRVAVATNLPLRNRRGHTRPCLIIVSPRGRVSLLRAAEMGGDLDWRDERTLTSRRGSRVYALKIPIDLPNAPRSIRHAPEKAVRPSLILDATSAERDPRGPPSRRFGLELRQKSPIVLIPKEAALRPTRSRTENSAPVRMASPSRQRGRT